MWVLLVKCVGEVGGLSMWVLLECVGDVCGGSGRVKYVGVVVEVCG